MEENVMQSQPELAENLDSEEKATTPELPRTPEGIILKFNKEIREISYDEAVVLAQKGLKFDKLSGDIDKLKKLAAKSGKSISEYITEIETKELSEYRERLLKDCGGNEELTEHILSLEKAAGERENDALNELKKEFPEINSLEDLPDEVRESVELFGGNLLSAYLLYNHRQQKLGELSSIRQQQSRAASVGSQQSHAAENIGSVEEFIKGIWS